MIKWFYVDLVLVLERERERERDRERAKYALRDPKVTEVIQ